MHPRPPSVVLVLLAAVALSSCATTSTTTEIAGPIRVHGRAFPASLQDSSKWIEFGGRNFRTANVVGARLGRYGYKAGHALHAEGDLPAGVTFDTTSEVTVTYDLLHKLNSFGVSVPLIAEGSVGGSLLRQGGYKLYVIEAAQTQEWKDIIRKAAQSGDQNLVPELQRADGYFRFVDAVLVMSDATSKRSVETTLKANATYNLISAKLDYGSHNDTDVALTSPRVVGYSLKGCCWGGPDYTQLVGIPDDVPAAGDGGECQSQAGRSPAYKTPPPQKKK